MQQFCTYGSVRGALGQLASLPQQKPQKPLPLVAAQKRDHPFVGVIEL